jgi:hypothetical protein
LAIKYLDANRIRGTATERLALSGTTAPPQTSWKELGRTTLSGDSAEINVTSLAVKDNLMILALMDGDNTNDPFLSFNGDEAGNYALRYSRDGGSDVTDTSQSVGMRLAQGRTSPIFAVITVRNIAAREKLVIGHSNNEQEMATDAPEREEFVGKWANTSNAITQVTLDRASGNFQSGSELIVLGCDDDEADSGTNFWQELSSTAITSLGVVDSGTFTAKKYLYGETIIKGSNGNTGSRPRLRFNDDTGGNYNTRISNSGASDERRAGYGSAYISESDIQNGCYASFYILNVSSLRKLMLSDCARFGTGLQRMEGACIWGNTSAQITQIEVVGSNHDPPQYGFDSGSTLRIWGSN